MDFNQVSFWIQIINVPVACMHENCARFWGSQIGLLQDVEVVGGSMRVRVKIDVTTPLHRGMRCFMEETQASYRESRYRIELEPEPSRPRPPKTRIGSRPLASRSARSSKHSSGINSPPHIGEIQKIKEEIELYGVFTVKELAVRKDLEYNKNSTLSPVFVSISRGLSDADRGKIIQGADMVVVPDSHEEHMVALIAIHELPKTAEVEQLAMLTNVKDLKSDKALDVNDDNGLGNPDRLTTLSKVLHKASPGLVFLSETKLTGNRANGVKFHIGIPNGFVVDSVGHSGGLLLLWQDGWDVSIRSYSRGYIDSIITSESGVQWRFIGFYGSPYTNNRKFSWDLFRKLHSLYDLPWVCGGDFNEILSFSEKIDGNDRQISTMVNFQMALSNCNLSDFGFMGSFVTWNNKRGGKANIQERLDRFV
ncbi:Endonuclease/exonuclease/phosphatase, partial [Trema orientale]